ncbi:MAG: maltose ABC transporter substrate-binding protein [Bacillota bacterium]
MGIRKWLAGLLAASLVAVALAGCGGGQNQQGEQSQQGSGSQQTGTGGPTGKTITVFSHLTPNEIKELQNLAAKYSQETGNKVNVVQSEADFQAEALAAQSKKFDVMYGLPNDNLGTFQRAGLVAEVPEGLIDWSVFNPVAVEAVTIEGKKWAAPVALETYALFYNTEKVPQPPASFEELVQIAKEKGGFAFDINNFYYSFAFLSANGGYVFKNNNGTLDVNDIGLANEGAIKGWEFLQKLVTEHKFMDPSIAGDIAEGMFTQGKTAFFISGPWSVAGLKEAGTPFAVAPLPTLNGNPLRPFVGVQVAFVNARSDNRDVAFDFIKWMVKNGAELYKVGNRLPVVNEVLNSAEVQNDPILRGFVESSKNGIPMPNIPEVQAMWTPGANALKALTAGEITPEQAAQQVVQEMKLGIEQMRK